ncbi:MAG: chemotaxis protein CheX [Firmicutes bacterium]|nr:chemotaxis protein CheX [Bacillota bacterium]
MNAQTINAFLAATTRVFKQFCNYEITMLRDEIALRKSPIKLYEINVHVGIVGDLNGVVYYSFPPDVAAQIASLMTGLNSYEDGQLSELAKSALCELCNIISGQAAIELSNDGYRLDLSPPSLFTGHGVLTSSFHGYLLGIPMQTPVGKFEIDVALSEDKSLATRSK